MRSDTGAPEDPSTEQHGDPPEAQVGRVKRAQARAAAARAEAQRLAVRAEAERAHHRSLDAVYEIADHDSDIGGSIMACALAYRLFIWLLPLALVVIPGLGLYSQEASETPERAARSIGLAGLVAGSVAEASKSSTRWYALIVGIPILVWATRSLLRALLVTHRLVWSDARGPGAKPTLLATAQLLVGLLGFFAISALGSAARARSSDGGVLVTLVIIIPYGALWLLISARLPHHHAPWRALLPGALLFAVGIVVLNFVTAYIIAPQATSKQSTYGALGLAAALLLALFLISRLVIASAATNAVLWERHTRGQ